MKAIFTLISIVFLFNTCSAQYYGGVGWKQTSGSVDVVANVSGDTLFLSKDMYITYVKATTKNVYSEEPVNLTYKDHASFCGDEIIFYKMNLSLQNRFSKITVTGYIGDKFVEIILEKSIESLTIKT